MLINSCAKISGNQVRRIPQSAHEVWWICGTTADLSSSRGKAPTIRAMHGEGLLRAERCFAIAAETFQVFSQVISVKEMLERACSVKSRPDKPRLARESAGVAAGAE